MQCQSEELSHASLGCEERNYKAVDQSPSQGNLDLFI